MGFLYTLKRSIGWEMHTLRQLFGWKILPPDTRKYFLKCRSRFLKSEVERVSKFFKTEKDPEAKDMWKKHIKWLKEEAKRKKWP